MDKQDIWTSPAYLENKKITFESIENYLLKKYKNIKFNKIMDIGCGLAQVPILFQKKYGSNLYLLEGDANINPKFYTTIDDIHQYLIKQNINYQLIDIENRINIPEKMDLIISLLAVGFHYPIKDWVQWIKDHSTGETHIILDVKTNNFEIRCKDTEIVDVIFENDKKKLAEIKII